MAHFVMRIVCEVPQRRSVGVGVGAHRALHCGPGVFGEAFQRLGRCRKVRRDRAAKSRVLGLGEDG